MFKNKNIILGVSGGIAAYKSATLASSLVKLGANVKVIMTQNACNFITPITFETLTNNKCLVDTFDRNFEHNVEHISLSQEADVFIVAPATANVIAKFTHGIADDMLSTTFLAANCPKIIAPAMNTQMYQSPITQKNIYSLTRHGVIFATPVSGLLACGDIGEGKMQEPDKLISYIEKSLHKNKDLEGKKVLVTAGATKETLDPVRYITNHSTGKMGYALAKECMLRGADVTLVSCETNILPPDFIEVVYVKSSANMLDAVLKHVDKQDIIIKAAAVSDYTPLNYSNEKIKKSDDDLSIPMKRTTDILKTICDKKRDEQFVCGFSMETQDMIENSRKKLISKNVDMIVANNLNDKGAGFATETNAVTIITKTNEIAIPLDSKENIATIVIDNILANINS